MTRWDAELGGCPLKAAKIGLADESGDMLDELPTVIAQVTAKLTYFSPSEGSILVGTVVDTSPVHIGNNVCYLDLIAFGLFNVIISKDDVKTLTFNNDVGSSSLRNGFQQSRRQQSSLIANFSFA